MAISQETQEARAALAAVLQSIAAARSRLQLVADADCELAELIDEHVVGPLIDVEGEAERLLAIARFRA